MSMTVKRCPKCRHPLELSSESQPSNQIVCGGCGARFKLNVASSTESRKPEEPFDDVPISSGEVANHLNPRMSSLATSKNTQTRHVISSPNGKNSTSNHFLIGGAIAAVVLLVVCGITGFLLLWTATGRQGSNQTASSPAFEPLKAPTRFATVSAPVDPKALKKTDDPFSFSNFDDSGVELDGKSTWQPRFLASEFLFDNPARNSARWKPIEVDPLPDSKRFKLATDLDFENRTSYFVSRFYAPLNGPFVIKYRDANHREYSVKPEAFKKKRSDVVESDLTITPGEPIEVLDLRNGSVVGEFAWNIPLRKEGRLCPNGKYYIGPDPRPDLFIHQSPRLFVWERDKLEGPIGQFDYSGTVFWSSFVSDHKFAMLVAVDRKKTLDIYDVKTLERTASIELPSENFADEYKPQVGRNEFGLAHYYAASKYKGVVSWTGKYVAIVGNSNLTFVSLDEQKVLGDLVCRLGSIVADEGLRFTEDGNRLIANTRSHLVAWSVADGATDFTLQFKSQNSQFGVKQLPGNRLLVIGDGIYDTQERKKVADLEERLVWWPSDGPAIVNVFARPRISSKLSEVVSNEIKKVEGIAGSDSVIDEPIQREVTTVQPRPPESWQPLDLSGLQEFSDVGYQSGKVQPSAFNGKYAAAFEVEVKPFSLICRRLDRETGNQIGAELKLLALDQTFFQETPDGFSNPGPTRFPHIVNDIRGAISNDGNLVAVTDVESRYAKVVVVDSSNKRVVEFFPYGKGVAVDWVGFNSDGMLLTVGAQKLTAWRVPSLEVQYELDSGYRYPAEQFGDRLIVSAGNYCDIIDTVSGACVNRHVATRSGWSVVQIIIGPEQQNLITLSVDSTDTQQESLHKYSLPRYIFPGNRHGAKRVSHCITIRDLKSGSARWYGQVCLPGNLVLTGEHLALESTPLLVFDSKLDYALVEQPNNNLFAGQLGIDDRLWRSKEGQWQIHEVTFSDFLHAEDRERIYVRDVPIAIQVKAFSDDRSDLIAEVVARQLQKLGYSIGPNGWKLRIEGEAVPGSYRLSSDPEGISEDIELPTLKYKWSLVDQNDHVFLESETEAKFTRSASKYFVNQRHGDRPVQYYKFSGDPWTNVMDELIEGAIGLRPKFMPDSVIKAGDRCYVLDLSIPRS